MNSQHPLCFTPIKQAFSETGDKTSENSFKEVSRVDTVHLLHLKPIWLSISIYSIYNKIKNRVDEVEEKRTA